MNISSSRLTCIFDQWAPSYDEQPNPLLALEDRTLPALMPQVAGADVVDIGCGTGRWLSRLEALSPASLSGTDRSVAMLECARNKLAPTTKLHVEDASSLSAADSSCDLILASFVLGYVADLDAFANECSRVLRSGGVALVSDMHPETAAKHGWTRSFRTEGRTINLPATHRSLNEILKVFAHSGLHLSQSIEPAFGEPERGIFERADKLHDYKSLVGVPAIYLYRFEKLQASSVSFDLNLINAPWSADGSSWKESVLSIENGLLAAPKRPHPSIDLSGYVLLPGLVNAHDHLEFALFPNLGRSAGQPAYTNASEWATEIHQTHAAAIAQHLRVPLKTRLWWGAIRNLLSGVTTVCHHNPGHVEFVAPDFPIRVLSGFGWAHSLAFAPDLVQSLQQTPFNRPFILHAGEGTDMNSRQELYELEDLNVIGDRTVLVHCLSFEMPEIAVLNARGASVIVCPTSNQFLFQQAMSPEILASIERVALGSDSPLTAAGCLLDEVAYLRTNYPIDDLTLFKMLTTYPASILRLDQGEGRIALDRPASLIAVEDTGNSPAYTLAHLTDEKIELVLLAGRVQVASASLYARLPWQHREGLEPLQVGGQVRYVRAPIAELLRSSEENLGPGKLRLGGKEIRDVTAA